MSELILPNHAVWQPLATSLIKRWESLRLKPYLCPAGKWTIGWGTTRYPDGRAVGPSDPEITVAQAEAFLSAAVDRVAREVAALLTRAPTAQQFAAMVCLTYNIGVGVRDGVRNDFADSHLLEAFNDGRTADAATEFPRWNKAHVDGTLVPLVGLTNRRKEEQALFLRAA